MNIKEAIKKMWERLYRESALIPPIGWCSSIGKGENGIVVFIRYKSHEYKKFRKEVGNKWKGFDVEWKYSGPIELG